MNHFSQLQLVEFVEQPDEECFTDVSLHIATCKICRDKVQNINQLKDLLSSDEFIPETIDLDMEQIRKIVAYVDGDTPGEKRDATESLIEENKIALLSMLHYRLYKNTTETKRLKPGYFISLWNKLKKWTKDRPAMGWQLVPVAAMLVYVINFSFISPLSKSDATVIASFQNEPFLQLKPSGFTIPGVGFFNQSNVIRQPYGKVLVEQVNDKLNIKWPLISKVEKYNFSLWKTADNELIVDKKEITANSISIDSSKLINGLSYRWKLSASTIDGYVVTTHGGIVKN